MKKKPSVFDAAPVVGWIHTDNGKNFPIIWAESPIKKKAVNELIKILVPQTSKKSQIIDPFVRDEIAKEIIVCFIAYKAYVIAEFEHQSIKASIDALIRLRTEIKLAKTQLPENLFETRLMIAKSKLISFKLRTAIVDQCKKVASHSLKAHFRRHPGAGNVAQLYMLAPAIVLKVIGEVAGDKMVELKKGVTRGPKKQNANRVFRGSLLQLVQKHSSNIPSANDPRESEFILKAEEIGKSYVQKSWIKKNRDLITT